MEFQSSNNVAPIIRLDRNTAVLTVYLI